MAPSLLPPWPDLALSSWRETRDTLHMWTQVVGKTLLACPAQNHFWHCALHVSARGLVSAVPILRGDRSVEIELDLVDHVLVVRSDGRSITTPLVARTVRAFHEEYLGLLRAVGLDLHIWTMPVEVPRPVPLDRDEVHREYDPLAANRFWQVLRRCDGALKEFASSFVGKQSPVQFFWGSFDLALTRFSGRRAPERPGADFVTREAYSHEEISFGFWPGGVLQSGATYEYPMFYAYAAPEPAGFRRAKVKPEAAGYEERLGEFVLPYEVVRTSEDPAAVVREFCQSVYEVGATLGRWDREAVESEPSPRHIPGADTHIAP